MQKNKIFNLIIAILLLATSVSAEPVGDIEVEGTLDARGPVIGQGIFDAVTGVAGDLDAIHLDDFDHSILHSNHTYLSAVAGINTGDQDLTAFIHGNQTALDAVAGINTGDQDLTAFIHSNQTALDAVAGVNTGDQDLTAFIHSNQTALDAVAGVNTGDQDLTAPLADIAFLDQAYIDRDSTGLVSGGELTSGGGHTVNIAAGSGYITNSVRAKVTWGALTIDTLADGSNYIGINASGAAYVSLAKPDPTLYLYLGHVYVAGGNTVIIEIFSVPEWSGRLNDRLNTLTRLGLGTLVSTGNAVSERANPNELKLSINGGLLLARLGEYATSDTTIFLKVYNSADNGWLVDSGAADTVNVLQWNDPTQNAASALTTMTAGYWKKDLVLRITNGNVYYIYGSAEYATENEALAAQLPLIPTEISEDVAYLAHITLQKSDTSIATRLHDIRPSLARIFNTGQGGISGSVVDHSSLTNLPYATAGHTGFEPAISKGSVTAGSNKVTIGGSPDSSIIGPGVTVDVNPANFGLGIFKTVAGDSGSSVAVDQISTINIVGGTGVVTSVSGTTLTISVGAYDSGGVARLGHSGGQEVYGGTGDGENLVLGSTINATKGSVIVGTELNPIVEVDETTGEAVITGALIIQ